MCTGPIVTLVLARDNAISEWRKLMGATNPQEAAEGTIRADFAEVALPEPVDVVYIVVAR